MVRTIITKAEFAMKMQRSRSCVSAWISDGKISPAAIIGDGRTARIWLERAQADLAASLDPSQQLAQSIPIVISTQDSSAPPANELERHAAAAPANSSHLSERERDLARRAKADADRAEYDAEAARRRLAIDEGRYILAEDAAAVWGKQLAGFFGEVENFIGTTLPRNTADRHNMDWKTLSAEFRQDWRTFRAQISDEAKASREAIEAKRCADE